MNVQAPESRQKALPQLDALYAALEAQGLKIDIEQRLRITRLLLRLEVTQSLPADAIGLCRLLTPILAGSPTQQAACEAIFASLFSEEPGSTQSNPDPGPKVTAADDANPKQWRLGTYPARAFAAAAIGLTAAAAVYCIIYYWGVLFAPPIVHTAATAPQFPFVRAADIQWILDYPIEELEPPRQSPWNRSWRWYYVEYDPAKWTALLLPWLALAGLMAYLYYRLLAYLRREALGQHLKSLKWQLGSARAPFGDRQLISRLQPLRTLARSSHRTFDAERTVHASAEAAGLLRPRFRETAVPIDFVAIIDRQSVSDHLAAYNMEVIRSFRNAGLWVEVFEYNSDPTLCYFSRTGEYVRLDTLILLFPDSVILLFATADQLIDPVRANLKPAVKSLKTARSAVLLSPEIDGTDGARETEITELLRVPILRTTQNSVEELVRILSEAGGLSEIKPIVRNDPQPDRPPLIEHFAERPGRWMQSVAPRPADRVQLRNHLRRALEPKTLRWLAATAIFPDLRWPLTLSLKRDFGNSGFESQKLDNELLVVSQLPWFRSGWMPDWTRSLLQELLSEREKAKVRRVVLNTLGQDGRNNTDTLQIGLANSEVAGKENVDVDAMTLNYLLPSLRSSRILFTLPQSWARNLIKKPLRRFAVVGAAGTVVAATASFGALSLLPIDKCDLLAGSGIDNLRIGPPTDLIVVIHFFRSQANKACKEATKNHPENGRFWFQLSRTYPKTTIDYRESLEASLTSANNNYPAGYNSLGYAYEHRPESEGGPDLDRAKWMYDKAVKLGNKLSLFNLGVIAENEGDLRTAFVNYRQYVDDGGHFTLNLARFYDPERRYLDHLGEEIVTPDPKKYLYLLALGVKRGGDTAAELGNIYESGSYYPRNQILANEFYETGIRLTGDDWAATNRARSYYYGLGTDIDFEKATYWAIYSAKFGNSTAFNLLHQMIASDDARFKDGYGPPVTFRPVSLLRGAAEAGDSRSQFELGEDLESTTDTRGERDHSAEAVIWYRKAAARGNSGADEALKRLGGDEE